MIHNLKSLGLAMLVTVALSAIGASAAQAEGSAKLRINNGAAGNYWLTGEAIKHKRANGEEKIPHLFLAAGREIECATTTFQATVTSGEVSEITVEPTYDNCTASGLPMTVTLNGCDYTFRGGKEDVANHFISGTIDIDCPIGKVIEIHIYSSAANHTAGTSLCTLTVVPQKGLKANTYTNTFPVGKPDDVDITTEISGIATVVHGSTLICGPKETTTAYTGGTTLRAYKDLGPAEGEQVNLTVVP